MLSLILAFIGTSTPVEIPQIVVPIIMQEVKATEIPVIATSTMTIAGKISYYSEMYKVSSSTIYNTIKCESGFNPKAIGDHGTSFGLSQIHLPAHTEITKEQAFNEDFAIDFMASSTSHGKLSMWSCARILGLLNDG